MYCNAACKNIFLNCFELVLFLKKFKIWNSDFNVIWILRETIIWYVLVYER